MIPLSILNIRKFNFYLTFKFVIYFIHEEDKYEIS